MQQVTLHKKLSQFWVANDVTKNLRTINDDLGIIWLQQKYAACIRIKRQLTGNFISLVNHKIIMQG